MSRQFPSVPLTRRSVLIGGAGAFAAAAVGTRSAHAAPPGDRAENGWVMSTLAKMTPEEKVGQLFVQEVYGSDPDKPDKRNLPQYGVEKPSEVVAKLHLGGVIYFAWTDSFIGGPPQVAKLSNGLQKSALASGSKTQIPLQIATDQEQGVVTRFGPPATQFPGSMALGAGRSTDDARAAAKITGAELRAVGINVDFAPDSDVNVNPLNPVIGVRSFSSDPKLVADMVAAQIDGYQVDGKVMSSTKHFPGHGDTATDSHTGLPVINHTREEWEKIDAPPFRAAIARGVDMVMSAHLVMPTFDDSGHPATLSKKVLTGLLREELGYDGVVITDGLMMDGVREMYPDAEVCVRAIEAGCDQLLMSPDPLGGRDAILAALGTGRLRWRDVNKSVERILRAKYRRGIVATPLVDEGAVGSVVGIPAHQAVANQVTERTITIVRNDAGVLPLKPSGKKILVCGYGDTTTAKTGEALTARGATVTVKSTGTAPNAATIAATVEAAKTVDTVLVLTNNADTKANASQVTLVNQLKATGKTVIAAAVRNPYDLTRFDLPTLVATYSYSPVTPAALVRVLVGEVKPTAKLPVDLPAPDDVTKIIYPFGHGLTY